MELLTLAEKGNTTVTSNPIDSHFADEDTFDLDKGGSLQIAFGITKYDSNREMINEPEYA